MTFCREHPSPRYQDLLTQHALLHAEVKDDAPRGPKATFSGLSVFEQAARIKRLVTMTGARSILDYGSGKGLQYETVQITAASGERWSSLQTFWGVERIRCYDPAYPAFSRKPTERFDGVVCTEVLEHCAHDDVPWILEEIFSLASRFVCLSIACHAARRTLPNGANTHSTIRPAVWWDAILRQVASRHPGIAWEAWLRLELRVKGTQTTREQRLGNVAAPTAPCGRIDVTIPSRDANRQVWSRSFVDGPSTDTTRDGRDYGRSAVDFYREFGALYSVRRIVSSVAFMARPVSLALTRPMAWAGHRFNSFAALRTLIAGRRVLVLGTGPSANDLESIPDDVVVLTCKFGPDVLANRNLHRRIDLYYYPNIRADRAGRDKRLHLSSVIRGTRIGVLVCENLLTLADVLPLKGSYDRLLLDFRGDQFLLRRLIEPKKIADIRGRSFCPWTSTGVRLIQYALYFGASEVYVIGIDLGQNGYASGHTMHGWHHEDIDRNFLKVVSERHHHVYPLSPNSPLSQYFGVREWRAQPREAAVS